ncbi:hypothetical protein WA026_019646 [Henosepilachna vigintioctopunctata]|uniref:Uncharacterized protein n=1 Tax=Henosepilachna vigintioctopunctata TaxID=420089 RepID=A0AAW1TWY0_9CUCU
MIPMIVQIVYGIIGFSLWISSLGDPNDNNIHNPQIGSQIPIYKQNGEVSKEKFVYLSIQAKGTFKLTLTSIEGDADMYIAQFPNVPSYEPEHYDLHSASCGEDIIKVPNSFERPFVVGIYGHSTYEVSKFHFRADLLPNNEENDTSYSNFVNKDTDNQRKYTNQNEQVLKKDTNVKTNVIGDLKSAVFSFLKIIDMVL